jgi:hypothetical protein
MIIWILLTTCRSYHQKQSLLHWYLTYNWWNPHEAPPILTHDDCPIELPVNPSHIFFHHVWSEVSHCRRWFPFILLHVYVLVLWKFLVSLNKLATVGLVLNILYKNVLNSFHIVRTFEYCWKWDLNTRTKAECTQKVIVPQTLWLWPATFFQTQVTFLIEIKILIGCLLDIESLCFLCSKTLMVLYLLANICYIWILK